MNAMIIGKGPDQHFFTCPACRFTLATDTTLPVFYSEQHAHDSGWRKTDDIAFCGPDLPYVWVCPDCWPGDAR